MALLIDTPLRCTGAANNVPAATIRGSQATALFQENVARARNDSQLAALLDHFDLWYKLAAEYPDT
jgi:hypothetical protein